MFMHKKNYSSMNHDKFYQYNCQLLSYFYFDIISLIIYKLILCLY